MSNTEILKAYPDLENEDIREAVRYAAQAVQARRGLRSIAKSPVINDPKSLSFC